jgi:segregation and condensation protein B
MPSLAIQIEAILYLKGQPLNLEDLAKFAGCDADSAADGVIELMSNYAHRDSALEVIETADRCYSLQLKESFKPLCDRIVPAEIGTGALRTLAAIALKGPISQSTLVELRGGSAYQHVQELVEMGLVRKRRQSGNRSSLVQVTEKFKQTYELNAELQPYLGIGGANADDESENFTEPAMVEEAPLRAVSEVVIAEETPSIAVSEPTAIEEVLSIASIEPVMAETAPSTAVESAMVEESAEKSEILEEIEQSVAWEEAPPAAVEARSPR